MVFETVTLNWKGKDYTIPPDQMMRCIALVEDVLTLQDLAQASLGRMSLAKLAMAFGVALRYAGVSVNDDEVYSGMFDAKGAEVAKRARAAVLTLQQLMIPPEHLRGEPGKKPGAASRRAASSPRRTGS